MENTRFSLPVTRLNGMMGRMNTEEKREGGEMKNTKKKGV